MMTFEEAQEYRHLLDRKKKALALSEEQRKKYQSEFDTIVKGTRVKILEYAYCNIRWGDTKEEKEKANVLLDMESLWDKLLIYEEQGEGEKIDKIISGLKLIYEAL